MTIAIPWSNLKHKPKPGDTVGLQVRVNDAHPDGTSAHRSWYSGSSAGKSALLAVQLADHADPPEEAATWIASEGLQDFVHVTSVAEWAQRNVEVSSGAQTVVSGRLEAGGVDGSEALLPQPTDWAARSGAALSVTVGGVLLPSLLAVPDAARQRLDMAKGLALVTHSIFDGDNFPAIDFDHHDLVVAAIGPYQLTSRFFDAKWNEVTAPKAPGRYGALVEFRSAAGESFARQVTLFKTAQAYDPKRQPYHSHIDFPAAFGISPAMTAQEDWNVGDWLNSALDAQARAGESSAVLLAGLSDISADPARLRGFRAWQIDEDWWSKLHKRLGENQDYPHLTHLPDGYDRDQKAWPLLLFLHGSGERGTDLTRLQVQGPLGYINKGHSLPFIVVEPLCPEDENWNPGRIARLLGQVEASERVDPKRVYVTGLSLGGFGCLDFAATYPDRVAAIASLSGGEDPELAERLRHMPTWFFHGAEDTVVPTSLSVDLAHAMQKLGAPVQLTVIPGVGHGDWDVTYANPALYAWFLQHSK